MLIVVVAGDIRGSCESDQVGAQYTASSMVRCRKFRDGYVCVSPAWVLR